MVEAAEINREGSNYYIGVRTVYRAAAEIEIKEAGLMRRLERIGVELRLRLRQCGKLKHTAWLFFTTKWELIQYVSMFLRLW